MLSDWRLERAGRIKPPPKGSSTDTAALSTTTTKPMECINEQQTLPTDCASGEETPTERTAGMVVIGDEILNGFTHEVNLQVASQRLLAIGIPLKIVAIV